MADCCEFWKIVWSKLAAKDSRIFDSERCILVLRVSESEGGLNYITFSPLIFRFCRLSFDGECLLSDLVYSPCCWYCDVVNDGFTEVENRGFFVLEAFVQPPSVF